MLFVDKDNNIRNTNEYNEVLLFQVIQELKLFKGENPMDQDAGIDYFKVFNMQAFLKVEAQAVLEKYMDKFSTLEIKEIERDGEKITMSLYCVFKDGSIAAPTLEIME